MKVKLKVIIYSKGSSLGGLLIGVVDILKVDLLKIDLLKRDLLKVGYKIRRVLAVKRSVRTAKEIVILIIKFINFI